LQFKVKVPAEATDFGSFVLKGEAPVYIGTTRNTIDHLRMTANNVDTPYMGMRRRGSVGSMNSVRSNSSLRSTCSLPRYSALSSRIPSWETLPPCYDDVTTGMPEEEDEDELAFEGLNLQEFGSTPEEDSILCDSKEPDEK